MTNEETSQQFCCWLFFSFTISYFRQWIWRSNSGGFFSLLIIRYHKSCCFVLKHSNLFQVKEGISWRFILFILILEESIWLWFRLQWERRPAEEWDVCKGRFGAVFPGTPASFGEDCPNFIKKKVFCIMLESNPGPCTSRQVPLKTSALLLFYLGFPVCKILVLISTICPIRNSGCLLKSLILSVAGSQLL
jgi:hypothetical protein